MTNSVGQNVPVSQDTPLSRFSARNTISAINVAVAPAPGRDVASPRRSDALLDTICAAIHVLEENEQGIDHQSMGTPVVELAQHEHGRDEILPSRSQQGSATSVAVERSAR